MSDRKYRQRGYMDDDRADRPRARRPAERRGPPSGPRGRGLGKPTATVFRCARCGQRQTAPEVPVGAVCPHCGSDLHTCTNCAHFDPAAANECRQPITDYVASKAKGNPCQHFAPKAAQEFAADRDRPLEGKAAFEALFKR